MSDLRERLERESLRVSLAPNAQDRMFERGERLDRRRRAGTIAFGLALLVAVIVVVVTTLPRAQEPAAPSPTDALQGRWTATFTCEEMVRAVEHADVNPQLEKFWRRDQARVLGSDDPNDPCAADPPPLTYTFMFRDGRLQIFDAPTGSEGFDGRYELDGDVMKVSDAGNNIVGTYRVAYRLGAGTLSLDLLGRAGRDAFFVGAWESGEFRRT